MIFLLAHVTSGDHWVRTGGVRIGEGMNGMLASGARRRPDHPPRARPCSRACQTSNRRGPMTTAMSSRRHAGFSLAATIASMASSRSSSCLTPAMWTRAQADGLPRKAPQHTSAPCHAHATVHMRLGVRYPPCYRPEHRCSEHRLAIHPLSDPQ
jgi:hypothetical protein